MCTSPLNVPAPSTPVSCLEGHPECCRQQEAGLPRKGVLQPAMSVSKQSCLIFKQNTDNIRFQTWNGNDKSVHFTNAENEL